VNTGFPKKYATAVGRGAAAFTMVEIAISIGVIGFALVAIIGILPAGMNVQKDNGEDTTISQDAPFFIESIRNGGTNAAFNPNLIGAVPWKAQSALDFLTNYVESITITSVLNGVTNTSYYTNAPGAENYLANGRIILGLLSTPEFYANEGVTNTVTARVRALSGPAVEQGGANSITAFRYLMSVELAPFSSFALDSTNFTAYYPSFPSGSIYTNDWIVRSNRWREAQYMPINLFELRLRFSWPVLPNGTGGPSHQSYRTLIAGHWLQVTNAGLANPLILFQPQWYNSAP
jgi:hypothetical protein